MARFVLVPGAGGASAYWGPVVDELRRRGHEAVAVDLPGADPDSGLPEYAERTRAALGVGPASVLVAASLGGFTAATLVDSALVGALVFVNAMIPRPGETAGEWWAATGSEAARVVAARTAGYGTEFDDETYFAHDVPRTVWESLDPAHALEVDTIFGQSCEFAGWPAALPITVLVGRDDRLFPAEFQRRVARERLGVDVSVIPGGHLMALANPLGVTAALERIGVSVARPG
ncbi:MAG: alpha/beta hydrolase [Actinobacteria bacterium]|nr:alpha/beta hydrolase [Actinomycetota bacterium]